MGRSRPLSSSAVTGVLLVAALIGVLAAQQLPTSARLLGTPAVPISPPLVVGGGEVVLDLIVGSDGSVVEVSPVRATPPFTDLLTAAVRRWRFTPATAVAGTAVKPSAGHVMVLAAYRPPQVYLGSGLGEPTNVLGTVAPELPSPGALRMPAEYPPLAVRSGAVLIEIDLSAAGVARAYKVLSPPSAFDAPALEAVRLWRFGIPAAPTGAEHVFAYAVIGFAEPITG